MNTAAAFQLSEEAVRAAVRALPSLPAVVLELLQSVDREDVDLAELAAKLAHDSVLAAKVLRVANSPFYGVQGKVASIQDALVVLGLQGVRTLATATAAAGVFARSGIDPAALKTFWRHSIATALAARELAALANLHEGDAFAGGLLHDLGRLVLMNGFPDAYAAVVQCRGEMHLEWSEAEQRVLQIEHGAVGGMLADSWRFPLPLAQAMRAHHSPACATEPARRLIECIHVADAIAHALDLAEDACEQVPRIDAAAFALLAAAEPGQPQALLLRVHARFADACAILL